MIPFSVADRRATNTSPTIETLLALLALPGSRCTASEIFSLLERLPIRRRFALTDEDMILVRQWISKSGIRWGIDAAHRKALQLPELDANTWRIGLQRCLLGYAMAGHNQTMFEKIMPYDEVEGGGAEALGRFISAIEALFSLMLELPGARHQLVRPERGRDIGIRFGRGELAILARAISPLPDQMGKFLLHRSFPPAHATSTGKVLQFRGLGVGADEDGNDKFTGRGHRNHICKDCQRLPREQRDRIDRMDELYGFLDQSNISPKNIARLEILVQHASSEVKELALLILVVARVKPHKRRRWKFLEKNHPELFQRLKALSGGDIPDADLSFADLDYSAIEHLESGGSRLFDSDQHEPVRWEDDPYWLVDSED